MSQQLSVKAAETIHGLPEESGEMKELNHVPATTPVEEITEHLRRDGYVIVDDLASTLERWMDEEVRVREGR